MHSIFHRYKFAIAAGAVAIMVSTILIHALALGSRTIHIDEGMGMRGAERAAFGELSYNPKNGHGPVFFYMGAAMRKLSCSNVECFRSLTSASALLAIVMLWLAYRRQLGSAGQAALLIGLGYSSGMVFYGAYFIHEMVMILFCVSTLLAIEMWMRTKKGIWISASIVLFSLTVMTKETALFTTFAWTISLLAAVAFGTRDDAFSGLFARRNIIFVFYGAFASALLYMSMFGASLDLFRSPAFWLERGTSMHIKPWYYFPLLAIIHEPFITIFGAFMAVYAAIKRAWNARLVFFFVWFATLMVIHSIVPYKTPWLLPYMLLPLALFVAFSVAAVWEKANKRIVIAAMAILAVASIIALYKDNFVHPDRNGDFTYAYLQSGEGLREMVSILDTIDSLDEGALAVQVIGRTDELLYVLAGRYDRQDGPAELGFPAYINYKHSAEVTKENLSRGGEYVFLKFTYIDPLPEIDLFVRRDIWERYRQDPGYIPPVKVRSDGVMRYH